MSKIEALSNPQYVTSQYRNADNLNARIRLHQRFSANPYGWHRWVFEASHDNHSEAITGR